MRGPPRARHLHRGTDPKPTRGGGGFLLFFAITVAQGSGEDLVAAQQCYKLSNVHPPTSYEVRGSPLTAPTLAFLPPVLAYCCSRGLLFTIVVHQGYCCSVVTVNNNNTVQKLTFGNSTSPAVRASREPGTLCGEVGRVLRFWSTQHPHPLALLTRSYLKK